MLAGRRFQFRPVLTVCVLIALAILIALGSWQLRRLEWKEALIAQVEARVNAAPIPFSKALARAEAGETMEYAPVFAEGVYTHDLESLVFAVQNGAPGVLVFTPLDASMPGSGRTFIYVNRGFAPQAFAAPEARSDGQVRGEVIVRGLFRTPERLSGIAKQFRREGQSTDGLWFVRDPDRFAAKAGVSAPDYYIDSSGAENPARWPEGGTTRLDFRNRHLEYALTWFGLAAALVGVWLVFSLPKSDSSNNFKK